MNLNLNMLFEAQFDRSNDLSRAYLLKTEGSSRLSLEAAYDTTLPTGPQQEFNIQKELRPLFGKEGLNTTPIGTHPDLYELEGDQGSTRNQYVCTVFIDIVGSTRLNLLYSLDEIYNFKNAVIKTCIEVIKSFDGYIHRIMGDAVMAFFGDKNKGKEDAVADALNAVVVLNVFLENAIKPWMSQKGYDESDFGFRVGCEFGNDEDVLWGHFGYQQTGEVSALGLSIDMASKLQGMAGKNQIMLGQSILDFIYWPEEFSSIKTKKRKNESINIPYVVPNIVDRNQNPINYKMRILDTKSFLQFSALPSVLKNKVNPQIKHHPAINFVCFVENSTGVEEYKSASKFLPNGKSLKFVLNVVGTGVHNYPLKVHFVKTNYGQGVPEAGRKEYAKVVKTINKRTDIQYLEAFYEDYTAYRGIHTIRCEVFDAHNKLLFRDWIGVFIVGPDKNELL